MTSRSMRARLTGAFALATICFMALVSGAIITYTRQLESSQLGSLLEEEARRFRLDLENDANWPKDWETFLRQENVRLGEAGLTLIVHRPDGSPVARFDRADSNWPRSGDWLSETIDVNGFHLTLAAPWHSTSTEVRNLSLKLLAVSTMVVLATAIGSWMLVGRVLSPIDRLAQQAASASTDDLHVRLKPPSADAEVVGLVKTLNRLLESLANSTESKERFYAAASHELRTPLQGMSSLLEYGLSRQRTSTEWQEIAEDAYGQSRRLCELTADLLALNQVEMAATKPPVSEVDAGDLIERHLATLMALAKERGVQIDLQLAENTEVVAPWNHLEMLVRNLLENAVKYCTPGGKMTVRWSQAGAQEATLTVWNEAELPEDLDTEKLCEPFYRMDAARKAGAGNGLGLAICKAICRANGWNFQLSRENGGLIAVVDLDLTHGELRAR